MASTAHTAHRDSEIINGLLSRVTHGFDSPNSPKGLIKHYELLSGVKHDFDSPSSPKGLIKHYELLSGVKHDFDSPSSP